MAVWGLQSAGDDPPPPAQPQKVFYIWPKSVKTWQLWQRLQTMWRSGLGGRDGLDWPSVTTWLRHAERMAPSEMADAMRALRAMEVASLNEWAKQREKQAAK